MKIDDNQVLPSKEEKEQSIEFILNQFDKDNMNWGILSPFKELPTSVILNASHLVKFLSILSVLIYFYMMGHIGSLFNVSSKEVLIYMMIMFFSPILFFIHLIDIAKSFSNHVFDLESTLKYKFHQIIGYKFVLLTFISLIISFILFIVFPNINFVNGCITVLASIFISTCFIYYVVFKFKTPLIPIILMIVWSFLHISLIILVVHYNWLIYYDHYKVIIYIIGLSFAIIFHIIQFRYLYQNKYESRGMQCLN